MRYLPKTFRKMCKNALHLKEKSDYQFKGQLTENYVLQQFKGMIPIDPRYYAAKNSEIDFVIQKGSKIIPIEVKGGEENLPHPFNIILIRLTLSTPSVFHRGDI